MWRLWSSLQWRHNGCDGVSNHQPHHCLLNRLFRCRSKKTSKLRVTGLCVGNSPVAGELSAQMASNAEMCPFDDVIICMLWILVSIILELTCQLILTYPATHFISWQYRSVLLSRRIKHPARNYGNYEKAIFNIIFLEWIYKDNNRFSLFFCLWFVCILVTLDSSWFRKCLAIVMARMDRSTR